MTTPAMISAAPAINTFDMPTAIAIISGGIFLTFMSKLAYESIKPQRGRKTDGEGDKEELLQHQLQTLERRVESLEDFVKTSVSEGMCKTRLEGVQTISKLHYGLLNDIKQDIADLRSYLQNSRRHDGEGRSKGSNT